MSWQLLYRSLDAVAKLYLYHKVNHMFTRFAQTSAKRVRGQVDWVDVYQEAFCLLYELYESGVMPDDFFDQTPYYIAYGVFGRMRQTTRDQINREYQMTRHFVYLSDLLTPEGDQVDVCGVTELTVTTVSDQSVRGHLIDRLTGAFGGRVDRLDVDRFVSQLDPQVQRSVYLFLFNDCQPYTAKKMGAVMGHINQFKRGLKREFEGVVT